MKVAIPRKPAVSKFKGAIDRRIQTWIDGSARPYLESLLRTAQAKMPRRQITFNDGMGMSTLYFDRERRPYRLSEAIEAVAYARGPGSMTGRWRDLVNERDRRYAERFPELVRFMAFVHEIEDEFGQGLIGEMEIAIGENSDEFPQPREALSS